MKKLLTMLLVAGLCVGAGNGAFAQKVQSKTKTAPKIESKKSPKPTTPQNPKQHPSQGPSTTDKKDVQDMFKPETQVNPEVQKKLDQKKENKKDSNTNKSKNSKGQEAKKDARTPAQKKEDQAKAKVQKAKNELDSLKKYNKSVRLKEASPMEFATICLSSPYSADCVETALGLLEPMNDSGNLEVETIKMMLRKYGVQNESVKDKLIKLQDAIGKVDKNKKVNYDKIIKELLTTDYALQHLNYKWVYNNGEFRVRDKKFPTIPYLDRMIVIAIFEVNRASEENRRPDLTPIINML